jgi:hypothetical protein
VRGRGDGDLSGSAIDKGPDPGLADDGPPVESILAWSGEHSQPSFLVKWRERSYIHSTVVPEAELGSARGTKPLIQRFISLCEAQGAVATEVLGGFYEVSSLSVSLYHFYVDRILGHRVVELGAGPRVGNGTAYVPGAPMEAVELGAGVPGFGDVFGPGDVSEVFLDELGSFALSLPGPRPAPARPPLVSLEFLV